MRKLLYLGHGHHNKTKSTVFLIDLLKTQYDVFKFDLDPQSPDDLSGLDDLTVRDFDVLVIFQVMPRLEDLRKHISWKCGAFFPMYDYFQGGVTLDCDVWYEYSELKIINFSSTLHEKLLSCGFDSKYVQYYPDPMQVVPNWGDVGSVYFWQRISRLDLTLVARLLKRFDLRSFHLHKKLDPSERFSPVKAETEEEAFFKRLKMTESTWYETRQEMKADMLKSAVYIAPRPYEGIGMSFLEAMAAGRCVVAPDCPTMNEYIVHGENGLLYEWSDQGGDLRPSAIDPTKVDIREIQRKAYKSVKVGYDKWVRGQGDILTWVGQSAAPDRSRLEQFAKRIGWVDSLIEEQPRPDVEALERDVFRKDPVLCPDGPGVPDVTVVTVVFNAVKSGRAAAFRQCLESVQKQTGVRLEHLIVDGASSDGTMDLVRGFQNPFVRMRVISRRDAGIYDAMNRGLWLAQGKYVTFLNSDDFYHDHEGLKEAFSRLEKTLCDFSFAPIRVLGESDGNPIDHPNAHPNVGKIFVNMEFSHQSVLVRRDVFMGIHGFDLRYRSAADYDSVLRLILTGHRACCVPRSYVTFRMGGFSCANMAKAQRETGTIFARLYNKYVGASLSREDGLRIYLTSCFPLDLKERLFSFYVVTFGSAMLSAESDGDADVPDSICDLIAFKHRLLPLKKKKNLSFVVRRLLSEAIRHPLWLTEFSWRYRECIRQIGKEDAARKAFNDMGKRLFEKRRGNSYARRVKRMAGAVASAADSKDVAMALPPRMSVAPADFWNVYGTYEVEPWGVWAPKDMLVKIRVPDECVGKDLTVELMIGGYVFAESPVRSLSATVNGTPLPTFSVDHIAPQTHVLQVPATSVKAAVLDFRLSLDKDFVPVEQGHSTDTRRLGLSFGGLKIRVA